MDVRIRGQIGWILACAVTTYPCGAELNPLHERAVGFGICSPPGRGAVHPRQEVGVREQVRERVEKARELSQADRKKEGIALLTESLPELEAAEHAGLRAYQLAHLAWIYMEDGERDWAVTLLERIREDPQLDEGQFRMAEAVAEGRILERAGKGRLQTRRHATFLSIESEGSFELRVGWQEFEGLYRPVEGGRLFTHLFSLEKDPFKTTNLPLEKEGFSPGTGIAGGRIEILEDSSARFRLRWSGEEDSEPFAEYTIYPTGQFYARRGKRESLVGADDKEELVAPEPMNFHRRLHGEHEEEAGGAATHILDYREPAALHVPEGMIFKNDAGDLDGDGFNESEGCYVVSGGRLVILEAGKRKRFQPAIKFRRPTVNGLPEVIANGAVADRSVYNLAWLGSGALLLHWKENIPAGERLELHLR